MSEVSPIEMYAQYPSFVKDMAKYLRLSSEEQQVASSVSPNTWALWGIAALAGDERTPYPHEEEGDHLGEAAFFAAEGEFRGQTVLDFRAGTLTQRVNAMYASKNYADRQRFDSLSDRVAYWTFLIGGVVGVRSKTWRNFMPQVPQTMIKSDDTGQLHIRFTQDKAFRFPVEGPADTVMSFGPGLTGAIQAGELFGHTKTLHLVSGGIGAKYIDRWNEYNLQSMYYGLEMQRRNGTLQKLLPPNLDARTAQLPEVRHSTEGIASGVGMLAAKSTLDIVLMSSVHTAGVAECHAGIRGAAQHLREGGLFVVKAPNVSLGQEAGLDRVAEYATELLGDPVAQGPCGELEQHVDPELPLDRAASFVIYQK